MSKASVAARNIASLRYGSESVITRLPRAARGRSQRRRGAADRADRAWNESKASKAEPVKRPPPAVSSDLYQRPKLTDVVADGTADNDRPSSRRRVGAHAPGPTHLPTAVRILGNETPGTRRAGFVQHDDRASSPRNRLGS